MVEILLIVPVTVVEDFISDTDSRLLTHGNGIAAAESGETIVFQGFYKHIVLE